MDTNQTDSSLPGYAELSCLSNFSFLHGASRAEELVERAAQLGYHALAITDECSMAGIVRAHTEAKRHGVKLLVGATFQLVTDDGSPFLSFVAIARDRDGYGNLCELITMGRTRGAQKGTYRLTRRDLEQPGPGFEHLRGLPGCTIVFTPAYCTPEATLDAQASWITATFAGRAWISLTLLYRALDEIHRAGVMRAAIANHLRVVATGQVLMHVRSRKPMHDLLSAIRLRKPVPECGYELTANAEQHLRSRLRLANIYPHRMLTESVHIANLSTFSLDELRYEYPDQLVPPGMEAAEYLRQETFAGAHRRFPQGIPLSVQSQLEHELKLISELQYESYFLSVFDIVRFARNRGILCQGRGSAANSATCYCLGITEVDPARGNLLFERFISKERNEPPDIDVDFEHQRREEVFQYLYGRYGRDRAALTAAVATYRPRSALRESGKALGVDPAIVDQVAKSHHWFDSRSDLIARFAESGLDTESELTQRWASMATQLLGFPRHLSQHSGGIVLAAGKLSRLVPIENAAMAGRSIIQWDKDDLDALGLLKVDILALGMLSAIRRTLDLVSEQRGELFEMQDIPAEDPETYEMLCRADSVGVFQVESRAQMSMLPRLRPRTFYDLVIEVAIVRPGPVQGGMVHPFLRRRQGHESVTYPSEAMRVALSRTLGVPIFQEQVMQVAMLAAGFSAGEADQLRRAMAAWKRRGGLEKYHERIVSGMLERGYDLEFAESIFRQIQGFGEYGFPESHAASFALLVYASAWLKRHEPAAFLCALLNSQPMGFYSPSQLVQDGKRHGVEVRPVDVTISQWDSSLERREAGHPAVRLGLSRLHGMREDTAQRIEIARAARPFDSIKDLARRAGLDRHDLQVLAAGNALRELSGDRRQALWQAVAAVPDKDLLRPADLDEERPALRAQTEGEEIVADYRAMGLTLNRHPLALLRPQLAARRFEPASVLNTYQNRRLARGCGIVTVRQRPSTANGVLFLTLEDETGVVNVIVWPTVLERFRKDILNATLMGIYGQWQADGEVRHLIAQHVIDLSPLLGQLEPSSRDFC